MIVRTFTLKDQTTISGVRAHPDECRRGGGYVDLTRPAPPGVSIVSAPYAPGELAAFIVRPSPEGLKPGHTKVPWIIM